MNAPPGQMQNVREMRAGFAEVLLSLHEQRMTGRVEVRLTPKAEPDRCYWMGGNVVGLTPGADRDCTSLLDTLSELKLLKDAQRTHLSELARDGVELARFALARGWLTQATLDCALVERTRRFLFRYAERKVEVEVISGEKALLHFNPVVFDVRPAIAYGYVHGLSSDDVEGVRPAYTGQRVRLIAGYDRARNTYGFPPAVLDAVGVLSGAGVNLGQSVRLGALSEVSSLGLLRFFDRLCLLQRV